MKRNLSIIFLILLVGALVLPMTARADLIYEPRDSFYEENREDCDYVGRSYTAKGPNGDVTIYESPVSPAEEGKAANGTALYVSYTYQDSAGILWACCDLWDDELTGWVPMDYLELIYDGISFEEEYGDQFVSVEIMLEASDETVYFWEYPGSRDYIAMPIRGDNGPYFQTSYTDADGNQWARCSYYMGIKGYWVNLSNATADYETLFPDVPEETVPPETQPAATERVEEIVPGGGNLQLVLILAVAAVVAVTALLIVRLKKKQ